jgi:hypothetical protein
MEAHQRHINKKLKETQISNNSAETGKNLFILDVSEANFKNEKNGRKISKIGSKLALYENQITEENSKDVL